MRNTVIYWEIKGELRLTLMQYVIADIIRQHSKNGGWCTLSKSFIASICGVSERGVFKTLNVLIEKGYVVKQEGKSHNSGAIRTTDAYNKHFPSEDSGSKTPEPELKSEPVQVETPTSEELFKLAAQSNEPEESEESVEEEKRRKSIQPIVFEINRYAHIFGKEAIRLERLRPDEWKTIRKICEAIGDIRIVRTVLGKLQGLGALGDGEKWNIVRMARDIELAVNISVEEIRFLEKYLNLKEDRNDNG